MSRDGMDQVPTLEEDPFSPAVLEDPHGFQQRLRDAGAVVRLGTYGVYGIGRYAEVSAALRNWQDFISSDGVGLLSFRNEEPWRPPSLLLEADPPHHDAPRRVLSDLLGPRALHRLRDAWHEDARRLLAEVLPGAGRHEIDGVTEIAQPFPLRVFPDAVGVPDEDRDLLLPYGDHLFNAFGPDNDLVKAGRGRAPEMQAAVARMCERDSLRPGSFGEGIWAACDRGELLPHQPALVVRSLLSAGVDTTVHGIAAVLHAFATHPEQWRRLREQPGLIRTAFDEAVRLEAPVQTFFRTAVRDVELGGTVVPAESKILMFLGSANRDPRRWEDADLFSLARDPSGHVGFGMGIHQCVGQHIARLEAEAVLSALCERVETIELAGRPVRHLNNTLRAWGTLPLRVTCT